MPTITPETAALMQSRPPIPAGVMDGYTNRKTRRCFTALLHRSRLEKLPLSLFPLEFLAYFVTNYPEACHGRIRHGRITRAV